MSGGSAAERIDHGEWWKAVLAEYPTGITLVTAVDAGGDPVGMIVGSFVAISQDPPLVGFFADDASSTFHAMAAAERFGLSVLGERQDDVLRAFIRKDATRFAQTHFTWSERGVPLLANAVAWFEARTFRIERFGDHQLVVGHVDDFGVGDERAGSPLLYRRGGFGAFAVPSDAVDARLVGERLIAARAASDALAAVARRIERDIAITTVVGDSVIVLAVVPTSLDRGVGGPDERGLRAVGLSLPFAAPAEPLFAAWAADRERSLWIERARHVVGSVDRRRVEAQLLAIRERGYALSVDKDLTARFLGMATDPTTEHGSYAQVWSEYASRTIESTDPDLPLGDIAALQVPVRDASGDVVLALTVSDLDPFGGRAALDEFARQLVTAARAVSESIASANDSAG